VRLLLDTHILLWYCRGTLPPKAEKLVNDRSNQLYFSSANIWEITTKYMLKKSDFQTNPKQLHEKLLNDECIEMPLLAKHMLGIMQLPNIHKDPFDRILLSQAISENCFLLTADKSLASYPGPIISA